ncbi:hypothetical protein Tco_1506364 [Tanacetum coccineum]
MKSHESKGRDDGRIIVERLDFSVKQAWKDSYAERMRINWKDMVWKYSMNWQTVIDEMSKLKRSKNMWCIVSKLVCGAAVYYLWYERNSRLFGGTKKTEDAICLEAVDTIRLNLVNRKVKESAAFRNVEDHWEIKLQRYKKRNSHEVIKVVNVVRSGEGLCFGYGEVVRGLGVIGDSEVAIILRIISFLERCRGEAKEGFDAEVNLAPKLVRKFNLSVDLTFVDSPFLAHNNLLPLKTFLSSRIHKHVKSEGSSATL